MQSPNSQAIPDFVKMTRCSWTYERMTDKEKANCENVLTGNVTQTIQGSYKQRWNALQAVYNAYLIGIGYNGPFWREPTVNEPLPFIVGVEGV